MPPPIYNQTLTLEQLNQRIQYLGQQLSCCYAKKDEIPAGGCCYEEIDRGTALAMREAGTVVPNKLYKITGVHKQKGEALITNLYNDGTDSGISILVTGISTTEFSSWGWGEFYNPKYIPKEGGMEDFDTFIGPNLVLTDGGTGYVDATDVPVTGGTGTGLTVDITTDSGNILTVVLNNPGDFLYTHGDILTITGGDVNATFQIGFTYSAYGIWDGDNPDTLAAGGIFPIGYQRIWGGYVWSSLTGNIGTALNIFYLDETNWALIPYNETDYNKVFDYIEYDWANDWICRRRDPVSNLDVYFPYAYWNSGDNAFISYHAIAAAQWGNPYITASVNISGSGIQSVRIDDSYLEFINFKGHSFTNVEFTGKSKRFLGYFGSGSIVSRMQLHNNCHQVGVKLNRGGEQSNFMFQNGSYQGSLLGNYTLLIDRGSNQRNFTFENTSFQYGNITIDNNSFQNNFAFITECGQGQDGGTILLDNASSQDVVYFANQCSQNGFTLDNGGKQQQFAMTNFASQSNFILDSATQQKFHIESLDIDYGGATITGTIEDSTDGDSSELIYRFSKTFDGTAGNGQVGSVTIQDMYIPQNFFIKEVQLFQNSLAGGGGARIQLGIETDDVDSGFDELVTNLAATPITIFNTGLALTQTTALRKLVMSTSVADVTAGTINLVVVLNKL